jgi:hypothetical protein
VSNLIITPPGTFHCGTQSATLTITETNRGPIATGSYYLELRMAYNSPPMNAIRRFQQPPLRGNTTRTVSIPFSWFNGPCDCFPSLYTINWQVYTDALSNVNESNEGNNLSNVYSTPGACP